MLDLSLHSCHSSNLGCVQILLANDGLASRERKWILPTRSNAASMAAIWFLWLLEIMIPRSFVRSPLLFSTFRHQFGDLTSGSGNRALHVLGERLQVLQPPVPSAARTSIHVAEEKGVGSGQLRPVRSVFAQISHRDLSKLALS